MERGGDEKGGQQLVIIRRCWGKASIYFSLKIFRMIIGWLEKRNQYLCPVCNTFFGVPTVHGFNFFWHSLE